MCRPNWPKNWQNRPKHRKATCRTWDNDDAKRWTADEDGEAQYNPYLFPDDASVQEIELRCIETGEPIKTTGRKRTFYLNCFQTVGVCSGEHTEYVFAEWLEAGEYHGRPISITALRNKGVRV